jgi:hypothetical protein
MISHIGCEWLVLHVSRFLNYHDLFMNFARTSKKTQSICLDSDLVAKRKYKMHKLVLHQCVEFSKKLGFDVEDMGIGRRIYDPHFARNYQTSLRIVTEYENRNRKLYITESPPSPLDKEHEDITAHKINDLPC